MIKYIIILCEQDVSNYKFTLIKDCPGTTAEGIAKANEVMKNWGMDLTTDSNRHDKSMNTPIQSKICIKAIIGLKLRDRRDMTSYYFDPFWTTYLLCHTHVILA